MSAEHTSRQREHRHHAQHHSADDFQHCKTARQPLHRISDKQIIDHVIDANPWNNGKYPRNHNHVGRHLAKYGKDSRQ